MTNSTIACAVLAVLAADAAVSVEAVADAGNGRWGGDRYRPVGVVEATMLAHEGEPSRQRGVYVFPDRSALYAGWDGTLVEYVGGTDHVGFYYGPRGTTRF